MISSMQSLIARVRNSSSEGPLPAAEATDATANNEWIKYSTNRRKALVVGINYIGAGNESSRLNGCVRDADRVLQYVKKAASGDDPIHVVLLIDDKAGISCPSSTELATAAATAAAASAATPKKMLDVKRILRLSRTPKESLAGAQINSNFTDDQEDRVESHDELAGVSKQSVQGSENSSAPARPGCAAASDCRASESVPEHANESSRAHSSHGGGNGSLHESTEHGASHHHHHGLAHGEAQNNASERLADDQARNGNVRAAEHVFGKNAFILSDANCRVYVAPDEPSGRNIQKWMNWLVSGTPSGGRLWFSYSGHGSSVRDTSGDERDGMDEVLFPCDFSRSGCIIDDWMRANFVDRVPKDAQLTCLIDACHSGTALDLRVTIEDLSVPKKGPQALPGLQQYVRGDWIRAQKRVVDARYAEPSGTVLCLSGCMDTGVSEEVAQSDGTVSGALTSAFLMHVAAGGSPSDLLQDVSAYMKMHRRQQRPVLSMSSEGMDCNSPWTCI